MEFSITYSPSKSQVDVIYNGLVEFNSSSFKDLSEVEFGIFVKNEAGAVVGGITGKRLYTVSHINYLWVCESFRSKGLGKELIRRVEAEAKENGVLNIFVETYTFQAPSFYTRLGFKEVGRYSDYPKVGIDKIVLQKKVCD